MEWNDVRIFLTVARARSSWRGRSAGWTSAIRQSVDAIKGARGGSPATAFSSDLDGLVLTDAGDTVLALAESME